MTEDPTLNLLGSLNQNVLWASCLWGALAGGYCLYGWKQKSMIPWLGGMVMTAACFMSSVLWMSLISVAAMAAVWWLMRQGY